MLDTTVDVAVIQSAVQLACRAPSLHNSQPWAFVVDGAHLDLFLEPSRAVHNDQSGREALMSCGAVLDHLRVAMAAAGWNTTVDRFPDPDDPGHLARVGFAPLDQVTQLQRRRADAILARRTDRLPYRAPTDWEPFEAVLRGGIGDGSVHVQVVPDEVRPKLAEAAQITESMHLYDWAYHAELDWWTAPFEVWDGIPQSSLISAAESDRVDLGRTFRVTEHQDRRIEIGDDQAKVVMLSTDGDGRADALLCGEALSMVLLECAMAGLATCPLTNLTELPASREVLAALTGHSDVPQVLIRVGVAPALDEVAPPTPRRPLSDVLRVKG